jgi:hypothetical protein
LPARRSAATAKAWRDSGKLNIALPLDEPFCDRNNIGRQATGISPSWDTAMRPSA